MAAKEWSGATGRLRHEGDQICGEFFFKAPELWKQLSPSVDVCYFFCVFSMIFVLLPKVSFGLYHL